MNRHDISIPTRYFKVVDGVLYRVLTDWRLEPVTTRYNNRPAVMVQGKKYDSAAIAWALHYGIWPMFPIYYADGDEANYHHTNLLPLRRPQRRMRITASNGYYYHSLSKESFRTERAAQEDWRRCYCSELMDDMAVVLSMQDHELTKYHDSIEATRRSSDRPPRARRTATGRPGKPKPTSRPKAQPGRKWHWFESEWISVPLPVHISDDCRVRCKAVKYAGAVKFYYDPWAERTRFWTHADLDAGKEKEYRSRCRADGLDPDQLNNYVVASKT